jgi:ABC-2 type transport system ATP-binding protein
MSSRDCGGRDNTVPARRFRRFGNQTGRSGSPVQNESETPIGLHMNRGEPSANAAAVVATRLTRRFDSFTAVDQLNFTTAKGLIFGLLGPNGAGKSTLIKMLITLLPVSEGTALVAGFDIVREPREVRRRIGYVPQMLSADGELTGYENLLISAKLYGIPYAERQKRISQALDFMELADVGDQLVSRYSGGMVRRLEIAQAMMHRPLVLFLDEPTIGLDPVAKHSFWQHIRDLRREYGTTIFMTTHDMEEAESLCEIVTFMHRGRIAASGSPAELRAALGPSATLDDVFLHYTGASISEAGGDFRDAARTRLTARRLG